MLLFMEAPNTVDAAFRVPLMRWPRLGIQTPALAYSQMVLPAFTQ